MRKTSAWSVEHEPESNTYLLLDASGAYCADLQWSPEGECWAQFEPYVAFAGPTTIADIERLAELAALLRELPPPANYPTKTPRSTTRGADSAA